MIEFTYFLGLLGFERYKLTSIHNYNQVKRENPTLEIRITNVRVRFSFLTDQRINSRKKERTDF